MAAPGAKREDAPRPGRRFRKRRGPRRQSRASASVATAVAQAVRILVTGSASAMQLTAPVVPVISNDDALMPRPSRPIRIAEDADQLGPEDRKRRKLAGHGPEHLVLADREYLPQRLRPLARRQRNHRAAAWPRCSQDSREAPRLGPHRRRQSSSLGFLLNPAWEPAGASSPRAPDPCSGPPPRRRGR